MSFPDGYNTPVGERGTTLSGGQKQRIAIARALLLNPRILILDDSTSSVDVQTEVLIQNALDRLMHGRTSFVIAQRISTVLNADKIIVLDKGRIAAEGKHQELMESSEIYAEIYRSQLVEDPVASAAEDEAKEEAMPRRRSALRREKTDYDGTSRDAGAGNQQATQHLADCAPAGRLFQALLAGADRRAAADDHKRLDAGADAGTDRARRWTAI